MSASEQRRRAVVIATSAAAAAGLAACGGGHDGGAGARPVERQPTRAELRAQEAEVHRAVLASQRAAASSDARYGGVPSYLPQAAPVHAVRVASAAHRVLAVQGDTVALRLAGGAQARAVAVGPAVPDSARGTDRPAVPATFVFTVSGVHGTVPLRRSLFAITDEQGRIHHPAMSVVGGGALPRVAPAGRSVTLRLKTRLPIGNGQVRYTPAGASRALAQWDFDNESD